MNAEDIDLATALKLLSLPRTLGDHPQTQTPVMAFNGRYGPYVKCGDETRSLPAEISPLDVTLEQALELLAQPKAARGARRRAGPIRTLEASPVTGQPVALMAGRYGPYVTDGQTNASLPKGTKEEDVTMAMALDLLKTRAERIASGEVKPRAAASRRRTAKPKAEAAPKAAPKAAAKKTAKKPAAKAKRPPKK
jgi:DNA topoisomerase I